MHVSCDCYYGVDSAFLDGLSLSHPLSNSIHALCMYCVIVYMLNITVSSTCIFCYILLAICILTKYLLNTASIASYNNNLHLPCTYIITLKTNANVKITILLSVINMIHHSTMLIYSPRNYLNILAPVKIKYIHTSTVMGMRPMLMLPSHFIFFLFVLLCIFSVTEENVSYFWFDKLHVYKQFVTCVYTHLNKYNLRLIVISCLHSTRLIHLCIIMYLCCIQLYYQSLLTVYTKIKSCNCLYYYVIVKCTLIQPCSLFPFFYLIVNVVLKNVIQTLSKYSHKNDSRFMKQKQQTFM